MTDLKPTKMKITITLQGYQVKGIKNYLKEVRDITNPTKKDIATEIEGIVYGTLEAPRCAVADYIHVELTKLQAFYENQNMENM